jgi:hypothetical protein
MRRKAVPHEMRIHGLFQMGGLSRLGADVMHPVKGEGLAEPTSRKEPGLQAIEFPVASQLGEQVG